MLLGKSYLLVGFGSLALFTQLAMAGETPAKDKESTANPAAKENVAPAEKDVKPTANRVSLATTDESVEPLIAELDSADYETREKACGKLAAKGKSAIPALEKAAANGNLEVSSRATTILGKLLKSDDEAAEQAANEALQRLADGDSPAAARKAKSILDKKNGLKNNGPGIVMPGNGFGGQIIINGGQLNIGGGGAMRTMSVKNVNGVKEIDVSEDGKNVKIQDDPAQGIKIELTEKQNGKEVKKKYEAKNAVELKKKQPAGYELYRKYGGEQPGNGIVQFQVQAGVGNPQIPGNAIPALPLLPAQPFPLGPQLNPAPVAPPVAAVPGNQSLEIVTRMAKRFSSQLERLPKAEALKNASAETKTELKKQIDELSKRLQELREQLGDK